MDGKFALAAYWGIRGVVQICRCPHKPYTPLIETRIENAYYAFVQQHLFCRPLSRRVIGKPPWWLRSRLCLSQSPCAAGYGVNRRRVLTSRFYNASVSPAITNHVGTSDLEFSCAARRKYGSERYGVASGVEIVAAQVEDYRRVQEISQALLLPYSQQLHHMASNFVALAKIGPKYAHHQPDQPNNLSSRLVAVSNAYAMWLSPHLEKLGLQYVRLLEAGASLLSLKQQQSDQLASCALENFLGSIVLHAEQYLHKMSLEEVGELSWHAAAVCSMCTMPVSPFISINYRMQMGIRNDLPIFHVQHTDGYDAFPREHQSATLRRLAVVLYPFSHPMLNHMPFLRHRELLSVLEDVVHNSDDPMESDFTRLIHVFRGIHEAKGLLRGIVERTASFIDSSSDLFFVELCKVAGDAEITSIHVRTVLEAFASRVALLDISSVAEASINLSGHLSVELLQSVAERLEPHVIKLSLEHQVALLLLFTSKSLATQSMLLKLQQIVLPILVELPCDVFVKVCLALCLRATTSEETMCILERSLRSVVLADSIPAEQVLDVSLAFAVCGRPHSLCFEVFNLPARVGEFRKRSLPTLVWVLAVQNYREEIGWHAIASTIVEVIPQISGPQSLQLYEAFTALRLLGIYDIVTKQPTLVSSFKKMQSAWASRQGWRRAIAREDRQQRRTPPYSQLLMFMEVPYEADKPCELYCIPYYLPQLKLIFEPVHSSPVHHGTGRKFGEIAIRHRVWSAMGFSILTVMHDEFKSYMSCRNGDCNPSHDSFDFKGAADLLRQKLRTHTMSA